MWKIALLILVGGAIASSHAFALERQQQHHIVRRSLDTRNLTDPESCIQNCSITSQIPKELETENPITVNCFLQKQRRDCYEECPQSDAKTIILDNIRPLGALCSVPVNLLAEDSACVRNQSVDIFKTCDQQCPPIPTEQISPAVVVDPYFFHNVVVHFESDRDSVEKRLKELCSFGTCQWACKKPIFENACGKGTADRIEIGYNLAFQTIPQLYVDLRVIEEIPEECKKYAQPVAVAFAPQQTIRAPPASARAAAQQFSLIGPAPQKQQSVIAPSAV